MTIASYSDLQTAAADWLSRSDLSSFIPDAIMMFEDLANRKVRHRKMVAVTDLTPTSGVCTLPSDYIEYIRVVEKASIRRELSFITAPYADQRYPDRTAGLASEFSIVGSDLRIFPVSSNDIELTYRQKIPALSESNMSNWLLTESPHLYLRGTQMMLLTLMNEMDTPRFQTIAELVRAWMDMLSEQSEMALYAHAPMHIRGHTP